MRLFYQMQDTTQVEIKMNLWYIGNTIRFIGRPIIGLADYQHWY